MSSNNGAGQKKLGKLTAAERIASIVDSGSFMEIDKYVERSNAVAGYPDVSAPGEGVMTGWAAIDGRPVCIVAQDYQVLKGSVGTAHAAKIVKALDMAARSGIPAVCIWDSGGARVQEGAAAVNAYASIAKKLTDISGVVPVISIAAGGMLGAASLFAPLSDFTIAVEKMAEIGVYAPMILASSEGKPVDGDALIGARVSEEKAANAQFACATEEETNATLKKLMGYLPSNNLEESPLEAFSDDDKARAVAADGSDTMALLKDMADDGDFFAIQPGFAPEMITGFAYLDGLAVGFVANEAGACLTPKGCLKAARFVRFLDAFDMPVVTIVNNGGVEVSLAQAQSCQVRALAKLLYAYAEAGCPMVTLITGRAIGEGYVAMGNKGTGADVVYAFPNAEISAVEAEAGGIILYGGKDSAEQFRETFASPMAAAKQGMIDDVIQPQDARRMTIAAIDLALNKREQKLPKKHGVMPL